MSWTVFKLENLLKHTHTLCPIVIIVPVAIKWLLSHLEGLLCGDPVPDRDGPAGAEGAADTPVVPEGHLPTGIRPQRPGPAESEVTNRSLKAFTVFGNVFLKSFKNIASVRLIKQQ